MIALSQRIFQFIIFQRRYISIVFVVLVVLIALAAAERLYLSSVESNWEIIKKEEENALREYLSKEFRTFEKDMVNAAVRITASLQTSALRPQSTENFMQLFDLLQRNFIHGYSLELYSSDKVLLAWAGEKGIDVETTAMSEHRTFYITQAPIYSYAILIEPIVEQESVEGYCVVKRLFDVNYPISNRFVRNEVFVNSFTSKLQLKPQFEFGSRVQSKKNAEQFIFELTTEDGKVLGQALVPTPLLAARQEKIHQTFRRIQYFLFFLIAVSAIVIGLRSVQSSTSVWMKILIWTVSIWLSRYILVWTEIPFSFIQEGIFDQTYFASSFGFGIARSVGDVLISSMCLLGNVIVITWILGRKLQDKQAFGLHNSILIAALLVIIGVLLMFFFRGYAATIRSAVFDSTFHYNDPMFILPQFPLAVMLFSLFLVTIAFVLASIGMMYIAFTLVGRLLRLQHYGIIAWLVVLVFFALMSALFGILHPNPLLSQIERLAYVALLVIITFLSYDVQQHRMRLLKVRTLILTFVVVFLLVIPLTDRYVRESDNTHVEFLAHISTQPMDAWLTFVVNKALSELSQADAANVLQSGNEMQKDKLAFTAWARSILSKEGYNCWVMYVDSSGMPVSDFYLGSIRHPWFEYSIREPAVPMPVTVEEKTVDGYAMKTYKGYNPVILSSGKTVGGVWVEVSAAPQFLLTKESPEIFRNYPTEIMRAQHRTIVFSEYHDGKLVYSSSESFPVERPLPQAVAHRSESGFWLEEVIEGVEYESYYLRQNNNYLSFSLEALSFRWHLFVMVRMVMFYLLVSFVSAVVVLTILRLKKVPVQFGVRTKLLLAFLVISFIPIAILAYYNRLYAIERIEQNLIERLKDETDLVAATLQKQYGYETPSDLDRMTDDNAKEISENINTDFSVYRGTIVHVSSKPEVYEADLIDDRISAGAFSNIMLRKKNFYNEHRTLGTVSYLVGYRQLVSQAGAIIGIVAVPTLFRQNEIDEEIIERNAYLFGTYALALMIAVVVGSIFANQIAAPVRRLQQATRRVAVGDLDVQVSSERNDEFGELERAFDTMTQDLKALQEQSARVQRELAWKEMAKQVAHEIKNPLTPIKLSIQHLRQAYRDGAQDFGKILTQLTETILTQIEALSRIASEFSHFARMPERKFELCDIHQILNEAAALFKQHEQLLFNFSLNAHSAHVLADKEELRRAFINIIRNAVQAMNEKGSVSILTSSDRQNIHIAITDTGTGIPEEIRNRLFEPNFSTKTEGMGLGLAIVKKTVGDLNGTISIESTVGTGTTVHIRFPLQTNILEH